MTRFILYIKSHCELPDYEDEVEAENIDEASKLFRQRIANAESRAEWTEEDLKRYIAIDKIPEQDEFLKKQEIESQMKQGDY